MNDIVIISLYNIFVWFETKNVEMFNFNEVEKKLMFVCLVLGSIDCSKNGVNFVSSPNITFTINPYYTYVYECYNMWAHVLFAFNATLKLHFARALKTIWPKIPRKMLYLSEKCFSFCDFKERKLCELKLAVL